MPRRKERPRPFPHSSTDLPTAYQAAIQLVDLANPQDSTIVTKVQSDHNCGSDAQCQAMATQMVTQIAAWSALEAKLPAPPSCPGDLSTGLKVTLPGNAITPASLAATSTTTLRWTLTSPIATLGKILFSVDVINGTPPSTNGNGNYLIQNLIVASQDIQVKVLSIVPTINGQQSALYNNYANLNFVVPAVEFDATASILSQGALSNVPQQLNWVNVPAGDSLGFVVTLQQTTDAPSQAAIVPGCKRSDLFQLVYSNVLALQIPAGPNGTYVGQCTRCHGDPTNAANAVMNLSGNGVDPCLQALTRTNLANPLQSLFILKPSQADTTAAQNSGNEHPVKIDLLNGTGDPNGPAALLSEKSLILNWINGEAAAAGIAQPH